MRDSKIPAYTLSHDEDDIPTYTHETITVNSNIGFNQIVSIIDENENHHSYLKKWLRKTIDVETRYWIHDGQLGGCYRVYDGKDSPIFEYIFKLTLQQAKLIADTILNPLGVCDQNHLLLFIGQSMSVQDLKDFIRYKKKIDNMPNPPKLWKIG